MIGGVREKKENVTGKGNWYMKEERETILFLNYIKH